MPFIYDYVVTIFGRDVTLTGRTDIWKELLNEPTNILVGTGYESFWMGSVGDRFYERYSIFINQAHNGYLETYLNIGLVGVILLVAMIYKSMKNVKNYILLGNEGGGLIFSFFIVSIAYNWTEAIFSKLSPLWFLILTISLCCNMKTKDNASS